MNEQKQTFLEKLASMVEPVAEAAEMLGVSRQRVLQLIKRGDLEAVKIGKGYFISSVSLQERLDTQRTAEAVRVPASWCSDRQIRIVQDRRP